MLRFTFILIIIASFCTSCKQSSSTSTIEASTHTSTNNNFKVNLPNVPFPKTKDINQDNYRRLDIKFEGDEILYSYNGVIMPLDSCKKAIQKPHEHINKIITGLGIDKHINTKQLDQLKVELAKVNLFNLAYINEGGQILTFKTPPWCIPAPKVPERFKNQPKIPIDCGTCGGKIFSGINSSIEKVQTRTYFNSVKECFEEFLERKNKEEVKIINFKLENNVFYIDGEEIPWEDALDRILYLFYSDRTKGNQSLTPLFSKFQGKEFGLDIKEVQIVLELDDKTSFENYLTIISNLRTLWAREKDHLAQRQFGKNLIELESNKNRRLINSQIRIALPELTVY